MHFKNLFICSTEPKIEPPSTAFPPGSFGSKLEHFETNYLEYLSDARNSVRRCATACRVWVYPYDGENPPATSVDHYLSVEAAGSGKYPDASQDRAVGSKQRLSSDGTSESDRREHVDNKVCDHSNSAINKEVGEAEELSESDEDVFHEALSVIEDSTYENMEEFMSMLEQSEGPVDKSVNIEDSLKNLDSLIANVSISIPESRTSTPRKKSSHNGQASSKALTAFCDNNDISSVCVIENTNVDNSDKSSNPVEGSTFELIDSKAAGTASENVTEFEVIDGPEKTKSKCVQDTNNATEFVDISMPKESIAEKSDKDSTTESAVANNSGDTDLSNNATDSFKSVENWFADPSKNQSNMKVKTDPNTTNTITYPDGILVKKGQTDESNTKEKRESVSSLKGDKSVRFAAAETMQKQKPAEILSHPPAGVGISALKHANDSPTVGRYLIKHSSQ